MAADTTENCVVSAENAEISKNKANLSEKELERLAVEQILKETKLAAVRADQVGPQGWKKCPLPSTNKRFLCNTLLGTLSRKNKDEDLSRSKRPLQAPYSRYQSSSRSTRNQSTIKHFNRNKSEKSQSKTYCLNTKHKDKHPIKVKGILDKNIE